MKVAVCLSGEPRQYKFCKDSHFEFILNHYDCDVFFATPFSEGDYIAWSGEKIEKKIIDINDLCDIYRPKKYEVLIPENYPKHEIFDYWDVSKHPWNKYYSSWRQWYMIMKSFQLIEDVENYDIILKLRFDLLLDFKINLALSSADSKSIWSCHDSNRNCGHNWMPDRIVWGIPSIMKKWMEAFLHIKKYWEENDYKDDQSRELIAENLNHWHCVKQGLEYQLYKNENGEILESINHLIFKTESGVNNYKLSTGVIKDRN